MAKRALPDRTGVLILPIGVFPATTWFAVALVWDAIEMAGKHYHRGNHPGVREQLLSDMIASLAGMLGFVGSLAVGAILFGAGAFYLGRSIAKYRALTTADKKLAGMA